MRLQPIGVTADAEHSAEHLDVAEHRECLQPDPDGQPSDAAAARRLSVGPSLTIRRTT